MKAQVELRRLLIAVTIALLLLLFISINASASWSSAWERTKEIVNSIISFFKDVYNIFKYLSWREIVDSITYGVQSLLEMIFDAIKYWLTYPVTVYGSGAHEVVTSIVPVIMSIIQPFFITMTIFNGIYYIFAASDPKRRSEVKLRLMKLCTGMVIVGLSMPLFQFLLTLSSELTAAVFEQAEIGSGGRGPATFSAAYAKAIVRNPAMLVLFLIVTLPIVLFAMITMALRYVVVLVYAIIFPAALFLYFFESTKSLGANLVYQSLSWIFMTIVQAIMVVITLYAAAGFAGVEANPTTMEFFVNTTSLSNVVMLIFLMIGGLVGVIISPLIMTGMLKWAGGAMAGSGMLKMAEAKSRSEFWGGFARTTVGSSMMGGGFAKGLESAAVTGTYLAGQNPTFDAHTGLGSIFPSLGGISAAARGTYGTGGRGAGPGGGIPWQGADKAAEMSQRTQNRQEQGLIRDFFENSRYYKALTYDKRSSGNVMARFGPGGSEERDKEKGSARSMPISASSTLSGAQESMIGQEVSVTEDYGAKSKYLASEGPPFLSLPLYFLGGHYGANLTAAYKRWKKGEISETGFVGVSLFETFKMFSPLMPIRHAGRILFTSIPEFVPPIMTAIPFVNLRDVALWGAKAMMGLSFGQMASRNAWSARMKWWQDEYARGSKMMERASTPIEQAAARDYMNNALGNISKTLKEMRDGGPLRQMKDPNFFNKWLLRLKKHRPELFHDLMSYQDTEVEKKSDVVAIARRAETSINRAGAPGARTPAAIAAERSALARDLQKAVDDEKDEKAKATLREKKDATLLMFDHMAQGGFTAAHIEGNTGGAMQDYMTLRAAQKQGIGRGWKDDGSTSDDPFDLQAMRDYAARYRADLGMGRDLVVERDGKFMTSSYRYLYDSAYSCASENEALRLSDGRMRTNIVIVDAKNREGVTRAFTTMDGSIYTERMKNYYEPNEGREAGEALMDRQGVGYMRGFSYQQDSSGNYRVFYRDPATGSRRALADLEMARDAEGVRMAAEVRGLLMRRASAGMPDARGVEIKKLSEMTRDDVRLDSAEAGRLATSLGAVATPATATAVGNLRTAEARLADAMREMNRGGLSKNEIAQRTRDFEIARTNLEKCGETAFKALRTDHTAMRDHQTEDFVRRRHGANPRYVAGGVVNMTQYRADLRAANQSIYFSERMRSDFEKVGYSQDDIDAFKLTLHQGYVQRGGTSRINVVCNTRNNEVAWVNTDDSGRRILTLNLGAREYLPSVNEVHAQRDTSGALTRVFSQDEQGRRTDIVDSTGAPMLPFTDNQILEHHVNIRTGEETYRYASRDNDLIHVVRNPTTGNLDRVYREDAAGGQTDIVNSTGAPMMPYASRPFEVVDDPRHPGEQIFAYSRHASSPNNPSGYLTELTSFLQHELSHDQTRAFTGRVSAEQDLQEFARDDTCRAEHAVGGRTTGLFQRTDIDTMKSRMSVFGSDIGSREFMRGLREMRLGPEELMEMVNESLATSAEIHRTPDRALTAESLGRLMERDARTIIDTVARERRAGIHSGGNMSDIDRWDLIRMARWQAVVDSRQLGIDRSIVTAVNDASTQLASASRRLLGAAKSYNDLVDIQEAGINATPV